METENVKYQKSYAVNKIKKLDDESLCSLFSKTIRMLRKFKEQIKGESENYNISNKWQLSLLIDSLQKDLCYFIEENEKKGKKEEKEEEKKNKTLAVHYFIYKLFNKELPKSGEITISDIASYFLIDKIDKKENKENKENIDKKENFDSLLKKEITKGSVASNKSTTGMFNNIKDSFELEKKLQHLIKNFTVFEYFNPPLDKSKLKSEYKKIVEYNKNIDKNFKEKFKSISETKKKQIYEIANGEQRSSKLLFDLEYARSQLLDAIEKNYNKYKNYNVKAISSKIQKLIERLENNPEIISNVYDLLNNLKRFVYINKIASYYNQLKTMISSSEKDSIEWFVKYLEIQEQSMYKTVDEILSNKKNEEIGDYIKKQISIIQGQIQNLGKILQEREKELKVLLYKIDDAFHLNSSKEFESEDSKKLKELFHDFFSKLFSIKNYISNIENKKNIDTDNGIFFRLINHFTNKKKIKDEKDKEDKEDKEDKRIVKIKEEINNILKNKKIDNLVDESMNGPMDKLKKEGNINVEKCRNYKFTAMLDYYKSLKETLVGLYSSFISESNILKTRDFYTLCNNMKVFFENIEKYKWLDYEDSIDNLTKLKDVVFEFKYIENKLSRNKLTVTIYDIG